MLRNRRVTTSLIGRWIMQGFGRGAATVTSSKRACGTSLLALMMIALGPEIGSAQARGIFIVEPIEWRDGKTVISPSGGTLRIRGFAEHPAGVVRVLINGQEVELTRDADDPNIFNFAKALTVTDALREVTITLVPRNAEQVLVRYAIDNGVPRPQDAGGARPDSQPPPGRRVETAPIYNPSSVALRSLLLPGLGQFQTRRPALGAAFALGAGGALAAGLMSERVTIECLTRTTDGTCPDGQARDELSERPLLVAGIAGFVVLGVISAFEARSAATRANERAATGGEDAGVNLQLAPAFTMSAGHTVAVRLVRVRF